MLTHPLSLLEARLLSAGFALSRRALLRQRRSNGAQARCSGIIAISGCRNLATSRTARARNGVDTSPSTHGSASPVVATGGAATTQTRIDTSNLAAAHQQRYGAIAHWELQLPAKGAVPHAPSQQAPGREASRTLAPPRGLLAQPSAAGARYASGRTAAGAAARQVRCISASTICGLRSWHVQLPVCPSGAGALCSTSPAPTPCLRTTPPPPHCVKVSTACVCS